MYVLASNQTVEKYPYSIGDLRKDNPQTSFPKSIPDEVLAQYNVFPLQATEPPAYNPVTQRVEETTPVQSGGQWVQAWVVIDLPPEQVPTQRDLDERRYQRRAEVQSQLIAWMAADNMSRVRSGVWTVADLTSLMADPAVTSAQAFMGTLSYELAAQSIMQATHPLLTPEIKAAWVGKLQEHFYLVP